MNQGLAWDGGRPERGPADNIGDQNLTQLLRSNLLSLREALFRHASFLEFLPAPEKVDRRRTVSGGGVDATSSRGQEEEEAGVGGAREEIDPEVNNAVGFPRLASLAATTIKMHSGVVVDCANVCC